MMDIYSSKGNELMLRHSNYFLCLWHNI